MKKLMVTLLGIAVLCSLCFAQGTGASATPSKETPKESPKKEVKETPATPSAGNMTNPVDNVVKMDKDAKKTALCCCLHEFTVTANAPTVKHGTTNFYMCGDGCAEVAKKATPAENEVTMAAWHKKYETYSLASNATEKEGEKVAKCVCGNEFTVTEKTPSWTENGVTMYLCGDGCKEKFMAMTGAERETAEIGYVSIGK